MIRRALRLVPRSGSRCNRPARYEAILRGHEYRILGALGLRDRRILSWGNDAVRLWRSDGVFRRAILALMHF